MAVTPRGTTAHQTPEAAPLLRLARESRDAVRRKRGSGSRASPELRGGERPLPPAGRVVRRGRCPRAEDQLDAESGEGGGAGAEGGGAAACGRGPGGDGGRRGWAAKDCRERR